MKVLSPFSAAYVSLILAAATLTGCGGKSDATVTVSGDHVVSIDDQIGITTNNAAELTLTTQAGENEVLTSVAVSSSAIAGLNEVFNNLDTTQYSTALPFTPVENASVSVTVKALNPDGKMLSKKVNFVVRKMVRYMNQDDHQVLSIHQPAQPKSSHPAILFIHGNLDNFTYFYQNAVDAAAEGYVTATMDFRTFDSFDASASHMPDQIEDVRCAIQYLKANSSQLNIDPDNIGIVGYSVGAHMGLLAAFGTTSRVANKPDYASRCAYSSQNTDIKAIATLSAPSDALHLLATATDVTTPNETRNAYERLIGVDKNVSRAIRVHYQNFMHDNSSATLEEWKTALRQAYPDPTTTLGKIVYWSDKISPRNILGDKPIPLYIMHGKRDLVFPCQHALWNVEAATQSDVYFYSFNLNSGSNDHFWQDYNAEFKTAARQRYTEFFDYYLDGENVNITTSPVSCDY